LIEINVRLASSRPADGAGITIFEARCDLTEWGLCGSNCRALKVGRGQLRLTIGESRNHLAPTSRRPRRKVAEQGRADSAPTPRASHAPNAAGLADQGEGPERAGRDAGHR
jgi:hypothetical protein